MTALIICCNLTPYWRDSTQKRWGGGRFSSVDQTAAIFGASIFGAVTKSCLIPSSTSSRRT